MSMAAALDAYMAGALSSVHTSIPATVVKYDEGSHRAQVKPSVRMLMDNGIQIELPDLMDVPVVFPSGKFFDLDFPLDKGDGVLLLFAEQDISSWKKGDSPAVSATASRFNLDAAIAIPGCSPKPSKGKARISIDKDGVITWKAKKFVFDGQVVAKGDIIARGDVFCGPEPTGPGVSLSQHIHPTAVGPTSPANSRTYSTGGIKDGSKFDKIQGGPQGCTAEGAEKEPKGRGRYGHGTGEPSR